MTDVLVAASEDALPGLEAALPECAVRRLTVLEVGPPASWTALDDALARLAAYAAVALTSPRAAAALAERLTITGRRWPADGPGLWAIGGRTASAVAALRPAREPAPTHGSGGAALARAMLEAGVAGPVLFPCGERHRDELPSMLRAAGVAVDEVVAYRMRPTEPETIRLGVEGADCIVIASPAAAEALTAAAGRPSTPLVAIGPTTAAAARALGWNALAAAHPTVADVAAAVRVALASPDRSGSR